MHGYMSAEAARMLTSLHLPALHALDPEGSSWFFQGTVDVRSCMIEFCLLEDSETTERSRSSTLSCQAPTQTTQQYEPCMPRAIKVFAVRVRTKLKPRHPKPSHHDIMTTGPFPVGGCSCARSVPEDAAVQACALGRSNDLHAQLLDG